MSLNITIQNATNLAAADSNGLSDPFCKVEIGGKKFKTKTKKKTLSPEWDEKFTFTTHDIEAHQVSLNVEFTVKDWDRFGTLYIFIYIE